MQKGELEDLKVPAGHEIQGVDVVNEVGVRPEVTSPSHEDSLLVAFLCWEKGEFM